MERSKPMVADRKALTTYIELLRFGPIAFRKPGQVKMSLNQIGQLLGVSHTHVAALLAEAKGQTSPPKKAKRGRHAKLKARHIGFLVSWDTLQRWAAKTLAERAVLFYRQFPEVKITPQTLKNIYRKHNITRKGFRYTKTLKIKDNDGRALAIQNMKEQVRRA